MGGKVAAKESMREDVRVKRRSRDQLEAAIVDAATEGFAAGGRSATIRSIAARAGVQPSVIFRYFGSKKALLGEVVARGARRDAEIVAEYLGGPPGALLAATLGSNKAFRAALLRGLLEGLQLGDVPGGIASVDLIEGVLDTTRVPVPEGERFDPRLVTAFLAAAVVGWQHSGAFFSSAAGLDEVGEERVLEAVADLMNQIYGLAEPGLRMD